MANLLCVSFLIKGNVIITLRQYLYYTTESAYMEVHQILAVLFIGLPFRMSYKMKELRIVGEAFFVS